MCDERSETETENSSKNILLIFFMQWNQQQWCWQQSSWRPRNGERFKTAIPQIHVVHENHLGYGAQGHDERNQKGLLKSKYPSR